jgi:hypothetical protein
MPQLLRLIDNYRVSTHKRDAIRAVRPNKLSKLPESVITHFLLEDLSRRKASPPPPPQQQQQQQQQQRYSSRKQSLFPL